MKILIANCGSYYNKGDGAIFLGMLNAFAKVGRGLELYFQGSSESYSYFSSLDPNLKGLKFVKLKLRPYPQVIPAKDDAHQNSQKYGLHYLRKDRGLIYHKLYAYRTLLIVLFLYLMPRVVRKICLKRAKKGFGMFDLVIVAGGHHFSDLEYRGYPGFGHELVPICLAYKYGIPFIITGSTIGPIESRFGRFITGRLLEKAREINLRDHDSRKYIIQVLKVKNKNVKVKADWAFLVDQSLREHLLDKFVHEEYLTAKKIAIVVRSGINYVGSVEDKSYLDKIAYVADYLIEEMRAAIILFPQTNTGIGGQDDLQVCYETQRLMKNQVFVPNTIDWTVDQVMSFYRNMDLIIAFRMHAIIMSAVAGGVPVIGISHSYKFQGLMRELGVEEFVLPTHSFGEGDLLNLVKRAFAEEKEIKARINKSLPRLKKQALENLEHV